MEYQRRTLTGKAYLETDYILFRGEERLKISIKDLQSVTARDGLLHLNFPGGPAVLELGAAAEKWVHKILHPPSRAENSASSPALPFASPANSTADSSTNCGTYRGSPERQSRFDLLAAPNRAALGQIPKLAAPQTGRRALGRCTPKAFNRSAKSRCSKRAAPPASKTPRWHRSRHAYGASLLPVAAREFFEDWQGRHSIRPRIKRATTIVRNSKPLVDRCYSN